MQQVDNPNTNQHIEGQFVQRGRERSQMLSGINVILGAWLVVSPYILNYGSGATVDQTIFGVIILLLAAVHYSTPRLNWPSWLNGVSGIWMVIAPFILGYATTVSYWNEVIIGAIVAILAFSNVAVTDQIREARRRMTHPAS
ncbi:MAG: SPW repeat protein [Candidatus Saccharimonadales bacterium]